MRELDIVKEDLALVNLEEEDLALVEEDAGEQNATSSQDNFAENAAALWPRGLKQRIHDVCTKCSTAFDEHCGWGKEQR